MVSGIFRSLGQHSACIQAALMTIVMHVLLLGSVTSSR